MVRKTDEYDTYISWADAVAQARHAYEYMKDEDMMWRWLLRGASGMYWLAPEISQ